MHDMDADIAQNALHFGGFTVVLADKSYFHRKLFALLAKRCCTDYRCRVTLL
jgi:hypothetical protein